MSSQIHNTSSAVPEAAIDWVRGVFAAANRQVTATLSRIPTHHEPELDMQLIAALDRAPAVTDINGWTVYIQTHFLGGRRHFYNWEVADIGLLVIFRDRGKVLRIKVGLLQSKRLYSAEVRVLPDMKERFQVGFGTLLQNPEAFRALAAGRTFSFTEDSGYLAISKDDEQCRALSSYEKMSTIPVYYLLYNPVSVPWSARIPATDLQQLPELEAGGRVVRAQALYSAIAPQPIGYHPTFRDVASLPAPYVAQHRGGWALEHFVADELLRCKEGHVAGTDSDHVLEGLFYRRTGPIAAAIAVTVEAADGVELILPEVTSSQD